MTSTIITKNSSTATSVPATGSLTQGELAVNVTDKRLFTKDSGGNVVEVGTNPSSLTMANGTANGIPYLNGSKVLTSGSALTFDGTNFYIAGSQRLRAASTGSTANGYQLDAGAQAHYWYLADNTTSAFSIGSGAGQWTWSNSGGELMRLTSTGLGIGTSSPSQKLHVVGNGRFVNGADVYINPGYAAGYAAIQVANAYGLQFATGNVTQATLDTSGNLGLGVTPSAWGSSYRAFEMASIGIMSNTSGASMFLMNNAYYNGTNFIYKNTASASRYDQSSGLHTWYNAPSGTAGTAITFTQALTLDSSGNLLCGTTSGGVYNGVLGRLEVVASTAGYTAATFKNATAGQQTISVWNATDSGTRYFLEFSDGSTRATRGSITSNGTNTAYNTSSDYRLKNITGPITTSGAYIDRLNPVEGTWKSDGSTFVGLIAHEVQEASRTQVATGTKDGTEMQAMDYSNSELIANLIAEVKSLRQRVATLEAK